jgi:hypothetical protein
MPSHHGIAFGQLLVRESNDRNIPIALTLRFSEDRFTFRRWRYLGILEGELFVAINSAFLVLELENCEAPDIDWHYDEPIRLTIEIDESTTHEIQVDQARTGAVSAKVGLAAKAVDSTAASSASASQKVSKSNVRSVKHERSYRRTHAVLRAIGTPKNPRWLLESGEIEWTGERYPLLGPILKNQKFVNIRSDQPGRVTLQIEVPPHGISVRDQSGAFASINKQKLARLRIAKEYRVVVLDHVDIDGSPK